MEQSEVKSEVTAEPAGASPAAAAPLVATVDSGRVAPQACPTCGVAAAGNAGAVTPPAWIYAIGRIEPRFPKISVEKEFAQVLGRDKAAGLTDRQALHSALSRPENRYLARQLCWVMSIEGLETYILVPRDPMDLSLLVEALRPTPQPWDLDCVIGVRGPIAPPEMCNGLMVPIVAFDQIYSFDREALIKALPREKRPRGEESPRGRGREERPRERDEFEASAEELFDRIMQMADNAGSTDADRALNYLAVRYHRIYEAASEAFGRNESLTAVEVRPSALSGTRKVFDVIFSYTNRSTDVVSKQAVRVDATDEFPFLVTKLSPYYDR